MACEGIGKITEPPKVRHVEEKNLSPIAVALGIIISLVGVFLALALHQVFPQGVNAISQLGGLGLIAAYGTLSIGFITTVLGAVVWCLNNKKIEKKPDAPVTQTTTETKDVPDHQPAPEVPKRKEGYHITIPKSFDSLFEGGVDALPQFSRLMTEWPDKDDMTAPIMKGAMQSPIDDKVIYDFVAIKMMRYTTLDKCIQRLGLKADTTAPEFLVMILYRDNQSWKPACAERTIYPDFFDQYVTNSDDSLRREQESETFKTFLQTGQGEDRRGISWGLMSSSSD